MPEGLIYIMVFRRLPPQTTHHHCISTTTQRRHPGYTHIKYYQVFSNVRYAMPLVFFVSHFSTELNAGYERWILNLFHLKWMILVLSWEEDSAGQWRMDQFPRGRGSNRCFKDHDDGAKKDWWIFFSSPGVSNAPKRSKNIIKSSSQSLAIH